MGFAPAQGFVSTSVSASAFPLLAPNGTAAAPSYSFSGAPTWGMFYNSGDGVLSFSCGGTGILGIYPTAAVLPSTGTFGWCSSTLYSAPDVLLARDAAAVLALKNGTTAQEFRVYGTTTGPKYASMLHNGTDGIFSSNSGVTLLQSASNEHVRISAQGGGSMLFRLNGTDKWEFSATTYRLTSAGNFGFSHGTSALATGATEGFFHLQSCAGTPSGTPASIPTGQIPMVYDSTNDLMYIYRSGWKKGRVAGVDVIYS